jgi:hypothetical protein
MVSSGQSKWDQQVGLSRAGSASEESEVDGTSIEMAWVWHKQGDQCNTSKVSMIDRDLH